MTAAKIFDLTGKRIFVAGHRGMVGSAIVRRLSRSSCTVITADRDETDLERQEQSERFLTASKPDVVVVAAAKVGGIFANDAYPAEISRQESRHCAKPYPRQLSHRGTEASLPRLILRLSKVRPSADGRGGIAHRLARADQ